MIGNAVTSKSCMGTWLILSIARQLKVIDAASGVATGGRMRVASADRRAAPLTSGSVSVMVMPHPPRWWGPRPGAR